MQNKEKQEKYTYFVIVKFAAMMLDVQNLSESSL